MSRRVISETTASETRAREIAAREGLYAIRNKLARAIERCEAVSMTESVMGYQDSAQGYLDIATEIRAAKAWTEEYMHRLILQGLFFG